MPQERYYHPSELALGEELIIEGNEHHHLATVMRAAIEDKVEMINGKGTLAIAKIQSLEKKRTRLIVVESESFKKSSKEIILAQAIPRPNRLDFIIEKGTELGMSAIWLFPGQHSEKKEFSPTQQQRLEHLAIAAMKQCGRLYLPEIKFLPQLSKWEKFTIPLYYGSLSSDAPQFMKLLASASSESSIFCVGPESGLSQVEIEILETLGGHGVKLNQNILRTETAAIAAITLMAHFT